MYQPILVKLRNMKFHEILFRGPGVVKYGQTNEETVSSSLMTKRWKFSFPWRTEVPIDVYDKQYVKGNKPLLVSRNKLREDWCDIHKAVTAHIYIT